jgi:hypothetical protein
LQEGKVLAQQDGPVCVVKWSGKRVVTVISSYHGIEGLTITRQGKETEACMCVIHYNQYMVGVNKKDQLLQMYLVERKRMNKWYMKLFRRLGSASLYVGKIQAGKLTI